MMKKRFNVKSVLAFALVLAMLLAIVPMNAFAAETTDNGEPVVVEPVEQTEPTEPAKQPVEQSVEQPTEQPKTLLTAPETPLEPVTTPVETTTEGDKTEGTPKTEEVPKTEETQKTETVAKTEEVKEEDEEEEPETPSTPKSTEQKKSDPVTTEDDDAEDVFEITLEKDPPASAQEQEEAPKTEEENPDGKTEELKKTEELEKKPEEEKKPEIEYGSYTGSINWTGDDDVEHSARPSFGIKLLQNGSVVDETGAPTTDGSYSFSSQPLTNEAGESYSYSISVPRKTGDYRISHNGGAITVSYAGSKPAEEKKPVEKEEQVEEFVAETVEIGGSVNWGVGTPSGASVTVLLKCDGAAVAGQQATVSAGIGSYSFGAQEQRAEGAQEDHVYSVSASAADVEGYTGVAIWEGFSVSVTYEKKAEPAVTSLSGGIAWPADAPDGLTLTVMTNGGDGEARTATFTKQDASYSFANLPASDKDGNVYPAYTVSAAITETSGYAATVSVSVNGDITVTATLPEEVLEQIASIEAAINALPSFEYIGNLDPEGELYAQAKSDYAAIAAMFKNLPTTDLWPTVSNYDKYCTLELYLSPSNAQARGISGVKNSASVRFARAASVRRSLVLRDGADIPVTITWDVTDETTIPASMDVTLKRSSSSGADANKTYTATVNKGAGKTSSGSFTGVSTTKVNGSLYSFALECPATAGTGLTLAASSFALSGASAVYRDGALGDVTVNVVWQGEPTGYDPATRPDVAVSLENATGTATIAAPDVTHTFTTPTKTDATKPIGLNVNDATNYTSAVAASVSGGATVFTVTMTYIGDKVEVLGSVIWQASAPSGAAVQIQLLCDGTAVTGATRTLMPNRDNSYTFGLQEKNQANNTAHVYTVTATPNTVSGYTAAVDVSALDITVYYSPDDTKLQEIATQFAAIMNGLPTLSELNVLDDTNPADLAIIQSTRSGIETAKALLAGLSTADLNRLKDIVGETMMTKYNDLASAGISLLAMPTNIDFSVSVIWKLNPGDTIPAATYTVGIKRKVKGADDAAFTGQTHDFVSASLSGTVWTHKFTSLPECDADGNLYTYYVSSWPTATGFTAIQSSQSVIFQQAAPTDINVRISFKDEPTDSMPWRPDKIKVTLNGASAAQSIDIACKSVLTGKFQNVVTTTNPLSVTADTLTNYEAPTYSYDAATSTFTVTYFFKLPRTAISGKIHWEGKNPTKHDVTVYLTEGGESTAYSSVLVPKNDGTYVFPNIPTQNPNGQLYYWGVRGSQVSGYTMVVKGKDIYYYPESYEVYNLRVNVSWNDSSNKRGHRPVETTVYLYRDGVYTGDELQVSYGDRWTNVFTGLERFDKRGYDSDSSKWHQYVYSVRAAKIPYYYAKPASAGYGTSVTLTYIYGRGNYGDTTTSTGYVPKLGDPLVYNAGKLSTAQVERLEAEDARALNKHAELVKTVRSADSVDFAELQKINKHIVAWLSDGNGIDYPVLKGGTINLYLNRLFNREKNHVGSLTMDAACNKDIKSRNTIIYARNMENGAMFGTLTKYAQQSHYDANKTMQLFTPNGSYNVELFAGFTTSDVFNSKSLAQVKFSSDATFTNFVDSCIKRSDFTSDVKVEPGDSIVTLVTSSYAYDGAYFMLMGKLVEN